MGNTNIRTSPSLLTVTVGIPAYNEHRNIESLLSAVLAQEQTGFQLSSIVVINDASTDDTGKKVGAFSRTHPIVRLLTVDLSKYLILYTPYDHRIS